MSKGGVLVKNLVSVPGPPPFKNPGSAPDVTYLPHSRGSLPSRLVSGQLYAVYCLQKEMDYSRCKYRTSGFFFACQYMKISTDLPSEIFCLSV